MKKDDVFEERKEKLHKIFEKVESEKAELVEGLIDDAAFLFAENTKLRAVMKETGMIKIHPEYQTLQKKTVAADQFLKNANTHSTIIKTLNGILQKTDLDDDDELAEFE